MDNQQLNTKDIRHIYAFIADTDKAIDAANNRINFTVSSEIVDRACEIVEAKAVYDAISRKGEFVDNPICLPCHQHVLKDGAPPSIGYWDTETAKLRGTKGKQRVDMALQFDTELKLGNEYWIAYKNKSMRAVSIGFGILDHRVEERDGRRIWIITKLELIEISCVAVGCNKQALAKVKGLEWLASEEKGNLPETVKSYFDGQFAQLKDYIDERIDEIKDLVIPGSEDDFSQLDAEPHPSGTDDKQISVERLKKVLANLTNN